MNSSAKRDQPTEIGIQDTDQLGVFDREGVSADKYSEQLDHALRGVFELTVGILERMGKKIGLTPLPSIISFYDR